MSIQSTSILVYLMLMISPYSLVVENHLMEEFFGTVNEDGPQKKGRKEVYKGVTYYVYEPDLNTQEIQFHYETDAGVQLKNIGELKAAYGNRLAFATNGGIFKSNGEPEGLFIDEGELIFPLNTKQGNGNFYLQPNGVFYINNWGGANVMSTSRFSEAYGKLSTHLKYAMQSGPMLVKGSEYHPAFNAGSSNKFIRSGVGLVDHKAKRVVFVLSATPVSFHELATFFKEGLGCDYALYLDGNISQMYNPDVNLGIAQANSNFSVLISVIEKQ